MDIRPRTSHDGVAVIEMALSIFILLVIAGGVFEFGMAFEEHAAMLQAARTGAREAGKLTFKMTYDYSCYCDSVLSDENRQLVSDQATASALFALTAHNLSPSNYVISVRAAELGLPGTGGAPDPMVRVTVARRSDRLRPAFFIPFSLQTSAAPAAFRVQSRNSPIETCVTYNCATCSPVPSACHHA